MAELTVPTGQWEAMNIDDTSVKIWIPEPLDDCLSTLSERFEQSKSDLARNGLMIHVHGRFVFEQLVANRLWKLTRRIVNVSPEPERRYCAMTVGIPDNDENEAPRVAFVKAFGKNTCDLTVWMPQKLNEDLERLAFKAGQNDSEYMRRALTAYYLGRMVIDPLR